MAADVATELYFRRERTVVGMHYDGADTPVVLAPDIRAGRNRPGEADCRVTVGQVYCLIANQDSSGIRKLEGYSGIRVIGADDCGFLHRPVVVNAHVQRDRAPAHQSYWIGPDIRAYPEGVRPTAAKPDGGGFRAHIARVILDPKRTATCIVYECQGSGQILLVVRDNLRSGW